MKKLIYTAILGLSLMCGSCTDFLEDQLPQGTISDEQLKNPAYIDNLVISAYAVWITAEDINSSFSINLCHRGIAHSHSPSSYFLIERKG